MNGMRSNIKSLIRFHARFEHMFDDWLLSLGGCKACSLLPSPWFKPYPVLSILGQNQPSYSASWIAFVKYTNPAYQQMISLAKWNEKAPHNVLFPVEMQRTCSALTPY